MSAAEAVSRIQWVTYRSPQSVIRRFVARRTVRSATVWAFVFGAYTASKSIGFATAAPTAAARAKLVSSFTNNVGLNALLGVPHNIADISGYTAWNTFSVITIIGSIWAFLLSTKYFRGEEEAGRTEVLLSGQTTPRRAAIDTLQGLGVSLLIQFVVVAVCYIGIGSLHDIGIGAQSAAYLALCVCMGTLLFMAVGALTSQLMPTRSRAASLAAVLFGIFFVVRGTGDASSARWLLDVSPLGWIERLRPLTGSDVIWLLPILGLVAACVMVTVYLAGRRDLGESVFADRDTAKPRIRLLGSTFGAAVRLTRGSTLGWLAAVTLLGLFYGVLTKTAAQAFSGLEHGQGTGKVLDKLTHRLQVNNEMLFLGVVFLISTPLVMSYAANAVAKLREDEAQGYVDNFLVRSVSRWRWLAQRALLIALVSAIACLLSGLGVWAGVASQHGGVAVHTLLLAGFNMLGAMICTAGIGILAMGLIPRMTSLVAFSVVGWSFMLEILGSGLHLNHWLLDTSLMHHVTLAPAVDPNWTANAVLAGVGLVCYAAGSFLFARRDLAVE